MMRAFKRNQSGVAMVTVLFVGAALTAVVSAASFVTIQQFQAGANDRKAATALGYAEAGIDRLVQYVRGSGNVTWSQLANAGCPVNGVTNYFTDAGFVTSTQNAPVEPIGNGTYQAYLTVYNLNSSDPTMQFAPGACTAPNTTVGSSPHDPHYFVITSTGKAPAAKRVVQQVIKVTPKGLPIGLYSSTVSAGGTPNITGDSLVTTDKLLGRNKLVFTGCDPYYKATDFWPSFSGSSFCGSMAPSAAHAAGGIFLKQNGTSPEFPDPSSGTMACNDNNNVSQLTSPTIYQSLWDGDGSPGSGTFTGTCGGLSGAPGTSKFTSADASNLAPSPALTPEDYAALKDAAQATGIYCAGTSAQSCTVNGTATTAPSVWHDADIAPILNSGTKSFIAYFDFTAGSAGSNANTVKWAASVQPVGATGTTVCSTDPTKNRSVVIVIRNGSFELDNGQQGSGVVEGALIMDGNGAQFSYTGSPLFDGPIIIPNGTINMGGGPTFQLDSCWVANMPTVLQNVTPIHWSEVDR